IPQVREKVEKRIRKDYPDGIAAIGTDALRFTFAALASYSRTINFDLKRAEGYQAFCNKLWNAARFVLMHTTYPLPPGEGGAQTPGEGSDLARRLGEPEPSPQPLSRGERGSIPATEAERWIVSRLHATLAEVDQHFATYRFDHLAQALYEFVWNEYCDWFLELSKPALNGNDADAAASTRHTLLVVLETVLRALHPIIPFITEEIWQSVALQLGLEESSILERRYPRADEFAVDESAAAEIEWFKALLTGVRKIRSEMNIAPGKTIPLLLADGDAEDRRRVVKFASQIEFLARCQAPRWLGRNDAEPAAAAAVVGNLRILIPLAGLIDLDAERARLAKEIARIAGEIKKCEGKLGNANFVDHAPAAVVEQERNRLTDWNVQLGARGPSFELAGFLGKQHIDETELRKIGDARGIQPPDQVVALVLHHPRVETFGRAVDRRAARIHALVTDQRMPAHHPAQARHRQTTFPAFFHVARQRRDQRIQE